jgi:hypothetical protein
MEAFFIKLNLTNQYSLSCLFQFLTEATLLSE